MFQETEKLKLEIENFERVSPIQSYNELEVYQISYKGMLIIFKEVLPNLPNEEKFDLKDQLRRSGKAIPRLIAEGFAKKHQNKGFQKYLVDAIAESNETTVGLNQIVDLYSDNFDVELIKWLATLYDRISKQIFLLKRNWDNYNNNNK